uniref:Uncharacterized protein n=1 Tax=Oryza punctata TaxID=4537 RepID=A0A0E0M1M4_ORYPU
MAREITTLMPEKSHSVTRVAIGWSPSLEENLKLNIHASFLEASKVGGKEKGNSPSRAPSDHSPTRIDPAPPPLSSPHPCRAAVNRPASPFTVLHRHHRTGYSLLSVFLKATAVDPVTPSSILVAIAASSCSLFPATLYLLTPILWPVMVEKDNDEEKKETFFSTGIIFASGKRSCCVLTAIDDASKRKDELCEVNFFDGTTKVVGQKGIKMRQEFKCGTIYIHNIDMIHGATVTFSEQEIDVRLILESDNSGVGIRNGDCNVFVHGCSTGNAGHLGSAVFNESKNLVGMNVSYTGSKGTHYVSSGSTLDYGGIVSALNLQSTQLGLALLYQKEGEKRDGPKNVVEAAGVDSEAFLIFSFYAHLHR